MLTLLRGLAQPGPWLKRIYVGLLMVLVVPLARAQPDYAPAHWNPVQCQKYYTSGNGHSFCVIHDMEGYYLASISYLNSCATDTNGNFTVQASIHYAVNGLQNGSDSSGHVENQPSDPPAGDITQCVRESYYAWHAICLNRYSFGTEHEGFVSNPAWYSEAMYQASAGLQKHLCDTWGIPKDRNHIVGHGEWQNAAWASWMAANFPAINVTCNSHTDPGIYWNWSHFITLINGTNYGDYWDLNGANAGAGSVPSGTWDRSSTNWTIDSTGASACGVWGGKIAIFAAGTDAVGAYTVNVSGTQSVNELLVQEGTVTFNGGQINFTGDGPWFSNYVASGLTATFNTPFGGAAAPDKWGSGKAVYNAASTCGGYFSLNQGTIAIGNDAALSTGRFVLGNASSSGTGVTVQSADTTAHTLGNRIILLANTVTIGVGGDLTFTGPVDVGSNATTSTTMTVNNATTTFSGVLTNTGGLGKSGSGTLVLSGSGANTYGSVNANGNTTVSGGTLKLSKSPGLAAVANGTLILNSGGTLLLGADNQIADAVSMTLSGGTFRTGGFDEQLGTVKLTANSTIDLGTSASVLKFAASSAVAWTAGTTCSITGWSGAFNGGGSDQVFFGTDKSGLSTAQLAQIRFLNPAGFPAGTYTATNLPTGEVVPYTVAPAIATQPPPSRIAVAGDTVSLSVTASGTPPPSYQWRFNSVNLLGSTATTLLLPNVTTNQSGNYTVLVTNLAGAVTSTPTRLTVYSTVAPALSVSGPINGEFQFSLTGVPGYPYAVLVSSNLADWTALLTNPAPFSWSDTNGASRFYRGRYSP